MHLDRYQAHYAQHSARERPHRWQGIVERLSGELGAISVLDYGCGPAANLARFSALHVTSYDPAVPEYAPEPAPVDLVVCMHVLEHVEPEYLDATLLHLWRLVRIAALVTVSCQVSTKLLPDGSPWHCCVKPPAWWEATLTALVIPGTLEPLPVERPGLEYGCLLRRARA